MSDPRGLGFWKVVLALVLVLGGVGVAGAAEPTTVQVEQTLQRQLALDETTGYIIELREKADLSPAFTMSWRDRGRYVYETLKATAEKSQAGLVAYLREKNVPFRAFWIDNIILVEKSNITVVNDVQKRTDVRAMKARHTVTLDPVKEADGGQHTTAVEANLTYVGADQVWALGFNGAGIVVSNVDTGARTTHDALKPHYRGWNGSSFSHDYNFYDPSATCSGSPCDNNGHGSHTMGTMVGDDGGSNQIGMAPGAKWIACKGCETNSCSDTSLIACAQWIAAPTKYDGSDPDPDMRPHIVNNSWGGSGGSDWYQTYVDAWRAAGIYPAFSIGNSNTCGSAGSPGDYPNVTGTGNFDHRTGIINPSYSSRGPGSFTIPPAEANGYPTIKPQLSAPGTGIRSSVGSGDSAYDGSYTGTSMASPHVAGTVALMWSACPALVGDYVNTLLMLENNATRVYDVSCDTGQSPDDLINNTYGFGRLNSIAAVNAVVAWCGPTGTLTGTVTTEAGAPLAGALVTAETVIAKGGGVNATKTAITDATGTYTMTYVPTGDYSVTATKFGYDHDADDTPYPKVATVTESNTTTVPAIWLEAVGTYVVDGFVTATEHEWPLWAKIDVKLGSDVVATAYTSPWNGYYEINLPNGATYDFTVHSMYDGYLDEVRPVTVASADQTQNFTLMDGPGNPAYACVLQGGINEQFEGDFPPPGWTVLNNGTAGFVWKRNDQWGSSNLTTSVGGSGYSADADSDKAGSGTMDTTLVSPFVQMPATPRQLVFASNFQDYAGDGDAWFDIWTSGGGWTNLWYSSVDDPASGAARTFDLTAYAGQKVQFRWRYLASAGYAWYWQIDNVRTQTFPVPPPPPVSQWTQNFDGVTAPALPSGWAQVDVSGTPGNWATATATVHPSGQAPHSAPNLAYFNSWTASSGSSTRLYKTTGENITGQTGYVRLWMYHDTGYTSNDNVQVQYSTNGTTWTNIGAAIPRYTGSTGWAQHEVAMTGVSGASVQIGLLGTGAYGNDVHIDDVEFLLGNSGTPAVPDTPTLECDPVPGSMVAGFVTDENTTLGITAALVAQTMPAGPSASTMAATGDLPAGFYYMFTPKAATAAPEGPSTRTFTATKAGYGDVSHQVNLIPDAVNRIDFVLPAASLSFADWPLKIDGRLTPDGLPAWDKTDTFSILNSGGLPGEVKLNVMKRTPSWPLRMPAFVPERGVDTGKTSFLRAPTAPVLRPRPTHPELAGALAGVQAYGVDAYPGENLVTWPDGSVPGTWTAIASVAGTTYFGGDFLNGDYSTLYVVDSDTNTLRTLDTTTGAMTLIGSATPEGGESWTGLKGSSDGNVYASATTCSASSLYTIDPATGAATRIGAITNGACVIDIAINADGEIYGVDIVSNSLLKIDPATGAGTVIGDTGADPNYAQGMDFEEDSGILYWAAYTTQGELRTIDTATGASYLIGSFPGGAEVDAYTFASGGGSAGLPWFTVTPTEGEVPADGQLDILGEFFPEGVNPAHFGLFQATIKTKNNTPVALPDIPVYFTKAFWDVPRGHWADQFIHAIAGVRISKGCGGGNFCPDNTLTRADMAILMVRAIHGPDYAPPPAIGVFADVPISDTDTTADYIEQLYNDGVVAGCALVDGKLYYCPNDLVNRAQMAVFICASLGIPPVNPPIHYFTDIAGYEWAEGFIEAIYNEGITAGCSYAPGFCPGDNITRAQLAVWLTVGLDLDTYLHPMNP